MRIGGLASGMDIDTMVKDLMKAERVPLDKLTQKKQYTEWQRDDYREINKMLASFSQKIFDNIILEKGFNHKTINVSNPNILSVKNLSSTANFQGTIEVKELAKSAVMSSTKGTGITDPSKKLSESGLTGKQSITVQAINKDGVLDEGVTIEFDPAEESLNSIISKINEKTGVTMFYDSGTQKVSMSAKHSGMAEGGHEIALTGGLFEKLNLAANNSVADANNQRGGNAEFIFNGLKTSRSSNTFAINGAEFTLKEKGTSTYSSATDVDKVFDNIKGFVDQYNELIGKINEKVSEKKYRSYQPLTKEEREALSDKEVELWDEKAKSGTLRGDSVLTGALGNMRLDLYSSVKDGTLKNLTEIGITTSKNYLDKGKLVIDEDKLKEAIGKDPSAIHKLFAADGPGEENMGIARKLRETVTGTIKDIEKKAGKPFSVNDTFSLGEQLKSLDKQITRFESRMIQVEDRYWKQFTAMEQAIQRANQQSAYLMNQFG